MTNIRNEESYRNSWWDWTLYNECFSPTHIKITDVDGLIERNNHFLLIETKGNGVDIPMGQRILFDHIIQDKRWHVLVIWGETDQPLQYQIWGYSRIYPATVEIIQGVLRRWFNYANQK